jgi:hypothetical protein
MIQAKDLRIGNYLQDQNGRICIVEEIKKDLFKASMIEQRWKFLPCVGIPLTEDILIKVGLNNGVMFGEALQVDWYIDRCCIVKWTMTNDDNDYLPVVNGIMYLHELQNAYWIFTGEELDIKL